MLQNQPDLMKVHINSTPNKNKTCGIDTEKFTLACIFYYTMGRVRDVGRCISYVRENCISYARQQILYHMHAKNCIICTPNMCVSYACQSQFLRINTTRFVLIDLLFIRFFMRPGSEELNFTNSSMAKSL